MLTLDPTAFAHLQSNARRITVCGAVFKNDGSVLRATMHDEALTISTGDFAGYYPVTSTVSATDVKSGTDLSVDNLEISGFVSRDFSITGFTVDDIEAGLFDNAPFEMFICQWDDPGAWQIVVRRGYLGEITRTAEGAFVAEWRGLFQALQQLLGETYSETCDVKRFGDARCGLSARVQSATVASVTSRRRFDCTISGTARAAGFFDLGEAVFTSGANAGYTRQIKRDAVSGSSGQLETWESFPKDVQVGDTLNVREGCDRRFETCKVKANVVNFRGHGRWIPGIPAIIRAP